ncbi:uncharacterized protein EV154DRAFT_482161 [Mucor mucedo]|uniref:uncharacterized protein n=1 Tax=Mucor mucedo TaxID=29922 RepID=UPI0022200DD5|nr:uncharacterized protein EV154DRAFT_482161 [Mucor mucedo]KAI7890437.1 hypothetical protein EV154DRAFT_482161 [Mucor mucedo]
MGKAIYKDRLKVINERTKRLWRYYPEFQKIDLFEKKNPRASPDDNKQLVAFSILIFKNFKNYPNYEVGKKRYKIRKLLENNSIMVRLWGSYSAMDRITDLKANQYVSNAWHDLLLELHIIIQLHTSSVSYSSHMSIYPRRGTNAETIATRSVETSYFIECVFKQEYSLPMYQLVICEILSHHIITLLVRI